MSFNIMSLKQISLGVCLFSLGFNGCSQDNPVKVQPSTAHDANFEVSFTLTLENRSSQTALKTAFSQGVWQVSAQPSLFEIGKNASAELQRLAESGETGPLQKSLSSQPPTLLAGVWSETLAPGQKVTFNFKAKAGQKLSFATMLAESNDLLLAPANGSLALFDSQNEPLSGDLSAQLELFDAGSEVNQAPGQGSFQFPRQKSADEGSVETSPVRLLKDVKDGFQYPAASALVSLKLENDDHHEEAGRSH